MTFYMTYDTNMTQIKHNFCCNLYKYVTQHKHHLRATFKIKY